LLVNSRIKKIFLQSHSRVGALEIVTGLFLDMDPFSKFIESSNWIFGDWVVFDTVVKSTWAVASVGSGTLGGINAVIGFVLKGINLIFAVLFKTNISIPLFGHGKGIVVALTIGSLKEWFSIDKTLGLIIGEFISTGTKTASVLTNIHEVCSSITLDISVSSFIALNISIIQSSFGTRTEVFFFLFSHIFVRVIAHVQNLRLHIFIVLREEDVFL